ncbi:PadR family transcriptional regulator [Gloeocapsopsis dulcis]|uniref:PadR family transcriptional regulator n=1 Tax=Gloeocapsopsis dulcis AAB1 = 1H9 TaxID=1433147 RepID=A0A6N8FQD8_9CHRO|nr:PadR family transcriptional regulator [Gloeocapsopsis dulcis]MUL35448.1 PadR family transcriptional regulator [Gloeocapsopsis dulcis AAB1 = 1H9]WNN90354.1 PadR family transcriptional regulator [Gloeocapsopsis dulcis]
MSLAYAILGFLQKEGMTGYDLKNHCFDQTIAHLWPADQAQIYKTLDKLVEHGWITCSVEMQRDRPHRKVYSVTETGKAELLKWLQSHQPLPTIREPLLVQLFFAAKLSNEAIVHLLKQELVAHRKKLADCEHMTLPPLDDTSANRDRMMQQLVLDLVRQKEQTYIDWLCTAIDVVSHLQKA